MTWYDDSLHRMAEQLFSLDVSPLAYPLVFLSGLLTNFCPCNIALVPLVIGCVGGLTQGKERARAVLCSAVFAGGAVGFPGGGETTAGKAATTEELVSMGCREIDMVNNLAWLKAGKKGLYMRDVGAVVEAAGGRPVKVILECHWLTEDEIVHACEWCVEAGAAWIKTGSGWAPSGATLENVALIKRTVGGRCQVKAAGGVRDLSTLLAMYDCGARRFGIGVRTAQTILDSAAGGCAKTSNEKY